MSLQFRLNIVIAISMFLIIGLGTLFTVYSARQSIHEEILSSINLALRAIDNRLSETNFQPLSPADWQSLIAIPEKTRHLHIQLVPLPETQLRFAKPESLATTASPPRWFVWAVKPQPLTETRLINTAAGRYQLVIKDNPNDEIVEAWGEAQGLLGLIVLQSLLIWILAHLLLGRALKSLPVILNGLAHIETGDYRRRLPDFDLPEFSKISTAFNHAASALEKSRRENRYLTRRSLSLQEEERRILSQELHDELGQSLSGIKVIATSMLKQNPTSQEAVTAILSVCDHLFAVVRSMMRRLRPMALDELGLEASLEDLIRLWREQNPETRVTLKIDPAAAPSNGGVNIHLFRIVQESLNNIARHAKASAVAIQLTTMPSHSEAAVVLTIKDDGRGYDPHGIHPGFGLIGIRERAESLGGSLQIHSTPECGTALRIEIPAGLIAP